jgi:hypothetical protein
METIIARGPSKRDETKHIYFVQWEANLHEESKWETFENVDENARELFEQYCVENANIENDMRFGKKKLILKDAEGTRKKKM